MCPNFSRCPVIPAPRSSGVGGGGVEKQTLRVGGVSRVESHPQATSQPPPRMDVQHAAHKPELRVAAGCGWGSSRGALGTSRDPMALPF